MQVYNVTQWFHQLQFLGSTFQYFIFDQIKNSSNWIPKLIFNCFRVLRNFFVFSIYCFKKPSDLNNVFSFKSYTIFLYCFEYNSFLTNVLFFRNNMVIIIYSITQNWTQCVWNYKVVYDQYYYRCRETLSLQFYWFHSKCGSVLNLSPFTSSF